MTAALLTLGAMGSVAQQPAASAPGKSVATPSSGHAAGSSATLFFSMDRSGPPPSQYTLQVDEGGAGLYTPRASPPGASGGGASSAAAAGARNLRLRPELVQKLFAAVPTVQSGQCETRERGLAKTGIKALRFAPTVAGEAAPSNAGAAECTFNYSGDDRVNAAVAAFEAVAQTLVFGDRLQSKLRFDRLGLDEELDHLQSAVNEQRALEIANIAPVLQAIVRDERVMEHARRRAESLLARAVAAGEAAGMQAQAAGASSAR